jgi:hypothetical protein
MKEWSISTTIIRGEKICPCHFVHKKCLRDYLGFNLDLQGKKQAINGMSYGTAHGFS